MPRCETGGVFYALYDSGLVLVDIGAGAVLWMVGGSQHVEVSGLPLWTKVEEARPKRASRTGGV